jgi:pyruvate/2-oxoglutarate dehydrogenase complex dihydrolipoamide dehydrogenase (E3) component
MYYEADKHFKAYGVTVGSLGYDWAQMQKQKDDAVSGLTKGIEGLFKKNKVGNICHTVCYVTSSWNLCVLAEGIVQHDDVNAAWLSTACALKLSHGCYSRLIHSGK